MFSELKVREFLEKVASSDPTPGCGSVAAMNVAAGCCCAMLMANVTLGKEKYIQVQNEVQKIVIELTEHKKQALSLMDRDKEAYDSVVMAFKMKKDTDEEKELRKKAIFNANLKATEVPLTISETAIKVIEYIKRLIEIGNKNAISDSLTGLFNCYAGSISSISVAKLNLSGTWADPETKANLIKKVKNLELATETALESIKKIILVNLPS